MYFSIVVAKKKSMTEVKAVSAGWMDIDCGTPGTPPPHCGAPSLSEAKLLFTRYIPGHLRSKWLINQTRVLQDLSPHQSAFVVVFQLSSLQAPRATAPLAT